jgi:hypothetical protein
MKQLRLPQPISHPRPCFENLIVMLGSVPLIAADTDEAQADYLATGFTSALSPSAARAWCKPLVPSM